MPRFRLVSEFTPKGDQPDAIDQLAAGLGAGVRDQVLLGATGTGKTFTMANVVARLDRPALVLAPNKTLAAQLYTEFRGLFPDNAVEYFVSYYDYYQPEAYLPHSDVYIEKDSSINDDIDKLRHAATHALLTRRDVLIVASVSCIYGLGSPDFYAKMVIPVEEGQAMTMESLLGRLVEIHYERNDYDFHRGTFRVRGDVVEIIPAYSREKALRIEFFGDEIESLSETDPLTGEVRDRLRKTVIYPGSHFVSDRDNLDRAARDIRDELQRRLAEFKAGNRLVEAQRLEQRTMYDLEIIEELGYCNGIENYSRHLDGRSKDQPPATLLDYFPKDFILFVDESHIALPQVGGMFKGDRSRKTTLVDFGFRLPSALDNRPLNYEEFQARIGQAVYVSATPGHLELDLAQGVVVEQIIRPTGLLDPVIEVRKVQGQIDDLLTECKKRQARDERVLVTTLTKRMAEDLNEYLNSMGVPSRYLHSDIDTLERMAIIQALRAGEFFVLVGINLLREGLDIPEVSLVTILDADKEGFLRSARSLIQTFGRAARNVDGRVVLYADGITRSMAEAMDETARRRERQQAHNEAHGITPTTIRKEMGNLFADKSEARPQGAGRLPAIEGVPAGTSVKEMHTLVKQLERQMREAARELEFERAAALRDRVALIRGRILELG
ncbi:MAG: excinuclease ABC subunit UvrB [Pseudodesulfovibrio sp.]|uniref:UvrABC system protein B n=1 Tax=Pseudodesulfovibrio aespoeensis (strain ATCC 700646 / DSM 10631 / Aspo-2) TaxID=643562 RepID=E6VZ44_PSEA9|nr:MULTISPECIES: excinuclease ABC subunit UvrB [Pseudodesulfovibrio]MBU4243122.1 excinuclease ABC subunit UvrB [Pseudomonadota bacterium]ADU62820.1 excinuclease ABC, B subunit [Pseudodesulfovibrio aespoeensis Aspo-2]MBU4474609.1 excinuclease ABC subunit UvrB [Pseudomonadota bacterium]MBU4514918.1 excinuclease ABC subunit UvrB [Pseudomonadota bacterium]MBU4521738.1 excinuclease ABC subunit UvrB [Pseudomonadota bacterium]